jgi:hypothetical protein
LIAPLSSASTNTTSTPVNNNNNGGGGGMSLLNRLFAVEESTPVATITPLPVNSINNNNNNNNNSRITKLTLSDRLLSTLSLTSTSPATAEPVAIRRYLANTSAGSLSIPLVKDMISVELIATESYLSVRRQGLQALLYSGLADLLHREKDSDDLTKEQSYEKELPVHFSRLLLAIHEEKRSLSSTLQEIKIETGSKRAFAASLRATENLKSKEKDREEEGSRPRLRTESGDKLRDVQFDQEFDLDDNDSEDDTLERDSTTTTATNNSLHLLASSASSSLLLNHTLMCVQGRLGPRYKHYLYQELCKCAIVLYEEALQKLVNGELLKAPLNSGSTAAVAVPLKTLAQIWDEWECLKVSGSTLYIWSGINDFVFFS